METIVTFVNILAWITFAVTTICTLGGLYEVAFQSPFDRALFGRRTLMYRWPIAATISGAWLLAQYINT
jgi:hypothetical protein